MILKNARIYGEEKVDIQIQDGKIIHIDSFISDKSDLVIDLEEKTLLPSFIDLNVNLLDNGFELDSLVALEKQCLSGGVSTIVLRDSLDVNTQGYKLYFDKLKTLKINIIPTIKILDKENKMKDISILLDSGAKGLEIQSNIESNFLRQSMQYAKMKDSLVFIKCFDEKFDDHGVMNDGKMSFELGLIGISDIAESSEVAKMKEISEFYDVNVNFDALSLARSFDLLQDKNSEISIHHLLKNDNACDNFNTSAKILPPLKDQKTQTKLKEYFLDYKIKFLTSLHSPISISKKNLAFDEAKFGVDAIDMYVSLCFTYFVQNNLLSWKKLCDFTSYNQAKFLGLNKGKIAIGYDADFIIFDEKYKKIIDNEYSLYHNEEICGIVTHSVINGEIIKLNN
ncbi:amidohydrolase family protein [Campylobacter insulaenigrae]|uniref:Amidohydrolase family protein n=1 Tax=Campylobacter insulaenigrae TaxID=260714 RepID=A0ABY3G4X2_9BACT|nr:amidohydrolase family protein [Campylobacter insulaenigrae]TWO27189.1 amidohydrolase family protein [Campylobacter insulaenigrae]